MKGYLSFLFFMAMTIGMGVALGRGWVAEQCQSRGTFIVSKAVYECKATK